MQTYKGKPVEHLGDGVYALYDGLGIWLHANDHEDPTDKIYLEPAVLRALNKFNEYCSEVRQTGMKEVHKKNYDKEESSDAT